MVQMYECPSSNIAAERLMAVLAIIKGILFPSPQLKFLTSPLRAGSVADSVPGQWSYTIGPCKGIELGDHLWLSRYLLLRLSEQFRVSCFSSPLVVLSQDSAPCQWWCPRKNSALMTQPLAWPCIVSMNCQRLLLSLFTCRS